MRVCRPIWTLAAKYGGADYSWLVVFGPQYVSLSFMFLLGLFDVGKAAAKSLDSSDDERPCLDPGALSALSCLCLLFAAFLLLLGLRMDEAADIPFRAIFALPSLLCGPLLLVWLRGAPSNFALFVRDHLLVHDVPTAWHGVAFATEAARAQFEINRVKLLAPRFRAQFGLVSSEELAWLSP